MALSSTVIIVKVLYEKRELDTLPGRITLGVLVLQDLFAILFSPFSPISAICASVFSSFRSAGWLRWWGRPAGQPFRAAVGFHRIARSPELVLVGALAWCFLVGEVGQRLELSREMGALVAGVAISTFPYALDVTAKVTTLRDSSSHCSLSPSARYSIADRLHHRLGLDDRRLPSRQPES